MCFCTACPATCALTLSLHDALPISKRGVRRVTSVRAVTSSRVMRHPPPRITREDVAARDRESTRLNSGHLGNASAVLHVIEKTALHRRQDGGVAEVQPRRLHHRLVG